MVKSVGPKFVVETGTREHSTKGITDGAMGTLNRTILVRGVRSGGLDGIISMLEKIDNGSTMGKVAATIHTDVFVRDITRKTFYSEKTVQELDRRRFGDRSFTAESTAKMVCNENVTCLSVKTNITLKTSSVGGLLNNEEKVNGETLPTVNGRARVIEGASLFVELGGGADRTSIKNSRIGKARYARYKL
jgi:hypothetical protein